MRERPRWGRRVVQARQDGRAARRVAGLVALAVAAGAGWWAGHATWAEPTTAQSAAPQRVEATVTEATVGRSVTYSATVTQAFTTIASNALAGTVTHVGAAEVNVGDELYSVDGIPVRAVQGSTPFWRDLGIGATGPDVAQLEHALVTLGYLGEADEKFTAATDRAVRAWQKAAGRERTGVVLHGEIVAVPALPTTVKLDEAVRVGLVLAGGESAVLARQATPSFALALMADQASQVPPDAAVTVKFQDKAWPAVITGTEVGENSLTTLTLAAPDGGPVCGPDCALLPAEQTVSLMADVELVPSATGPGVPAAAVRTDAAGETYVLAADGTHVPVTVTASGDGIAVVDGLEIGDTVLVLDGTADVGPDAGDGAGQGSDDDGQ